MRPTSQVSSPGSSQELSEQPLGPPHSSETERVAPGPMAFQRACHENQEERVSGRKECEWYSSKLDTSVEWTHS